MDEHTEIQIYPVLIGLNTEVPKIDNFSSKFLWEVIRTTWTSTTHWYVGIVICATDRVLTTLFCFRKYSNDLK